MIFLIADPTLFVVVREAIFFSNDVGDAGRFPPLYRPDRVLRLLRRLNDRLVSTFLDRFFTFGRERLERDDLERGERDRRLRLDRPE